MPHRVPTCGRFSSYQVSETGPRFDNHGRCTFMTPQRKALELHALMRGNKLMLRRSSSVRHEEWRSEKLLHVHSPALHQRFHTRASRRHETKRKESNKGIL